MRIELPNNWMPRPYQRPLWRYLENGGKRAIVIWPRRHGKDDVGLHWSAVAMHERVGNVWHLLPEAAQARKAIWHAINPHTGRRRIDEAFPLELRRKTRDQEMFIEFKCGSSWQLVGSDNYDSLVGSTPVGVVFSEWALADPNAWAFIRPILVENDGWAIFITTPRGLNHASTMYEAARTDAGWFAELLKSTDTGVFTAEQLDRERSELIALFGDEEGEARFRQEYLSDFTSAMPGSYYGRLLQRADDEKRIGVVPHDPALLVETWWDLGIGDATAIWFAQRAGRAVHLINYYEASGEGLPHYAALLQRLASERGYVYGDHVMPHDTRSRDLSSGQTREQTLINLGIRPTIQSTTPLSERGYRADGIEQVRRMLPRCWFDADRCAAGISSLRQYRRDYDDKRRVYSDTPRHDFCSHAADAFRIGAMHRPIEAGPALFERVQQPYDMMEH